MTTTCTARQTDAVGAALDCELPTGHEGPHEAHTTPDVTVTWTGGNTTATPQAARKARRDMLRHLATRVGRGRAGADIGTMLGLAVDAEIADADEARAEAAATRDGIGQLRNQHEARRTALAHALGLDSGASWDVILDRAATIKAAAYERADLLEAARDALSTAGQNGPHADDWPAIAPGIEALAAERDRARQGETEAVRAREAADKSAAHLRELFEAASRQRDASDEAARVAMEQRQQMAAERYALQQRADLADRVNRNAAKDAADALARAEQAEAAITRVREQVAEWRTWAGTQHAIRDMLRALGDTSEPPPQDPTALDSTMSPLPGQRITAEQYAAATVLPPGAPLAADVLRAALDGTGDAEPEGTHRYLSTGCLHGHHAYCQGRTGQAGAKKPARCKFCGARCVCDCHTDTPGEPEPQPERCCVCGSTTVVYRNFEDNPFCGSCANCRCGANPCARTGINDPAVSAEAAEPEATCLGCGHTVPSEGCGCPPPQPTAPRPLVISIDLSDTAIADAIRRAVQRTSRYVQRHPGSPS